MLLTIILQRLHNFHLINPNIHLPLPNFTIIINKILCNIMIMLPKILISKMNNKTQN